MKKLTLKVLAVLSAVAMLIGGLPFSALPVGGLVAGAAEIVDSGELYPDGEWTLDSDGVLTISGSAGTGEFSGQEIDSDGDYYYAGYRNIRKVVIREGVTLIDSIAFANCVNLESVSIPASVTYIGESVFSGCGKLTEISVDENNEIYSSEDGVLFEKNGEWRDPFDEVLYDRAKILLKYPEGRPDADYHVPDDVTVIADYAFSNCKKLVAVTIPDSVEILGDFAFSIKRKGDLDRWGDGSGETSLESVTIGRSVGKMHPYNGFAMFDGCTALKEIVVDPGNETYRSEDGVLFDDSIEDTKLVWYPSGKPDREYRIPDGVSSANISYAANLERLIIPADIGYDLHIGNGCTALKEFVVEPGHEFYNVEDGVLFRDGVMRNPDGEEEPYKEIVKYPSGKAETEYEIPDDVTKIGQEAFSDVCKLEKITIPGGVKYFGNYYYVDFTALKDIYYGRTKSDWESLRQNPFAITNAIVHCSDGDIVPDAPEVPTTEAPTTEAPTTEAPTTEAPTTEVPTTEAPTTVAPTTEAPTTEAPTTEVPTTEAPTTVAPTTEAPTTEAPTTVAPTTEEPYTEVPSGDLVSKDREKAVVNDAEKQIAVLPGMTAEELEDVLDGDVTIVDAEGNELSAGAKIGTGARVIVSGSAAGISELLGMDREELKEFLDSLGVSYFIDFSDISEEELREILKNLDVTYADENGNVIAGTPVETEYEIVVPGDTDGDGKVGAGDARSALRASARIEPLSGAYGSAADIDVNGSVKASDARTILRVAAKLETIGLSGR